MYQFLTIPYAGLSMPNLTYLFIYLARCELIYSGVWFAFQGYNRLCVVSPNTLEPNTPNELVNWQSPGLKSTRATIVLVKRSLEDTDA